MLRGLSFIASGFWIIMDIFIKAENFKLATLFYMAIELAVSVQFKKHNGPCVSFVVLVIVLRSD